MDLGQFEQLEKSIIQNISNDFNYHKFITEFHNRGRDRVFDRLYGTVVFITVLLSLVSFVGTVGNCLVIYAFRRHLNKNSSGGGTVSNFFILLLAVIDLVICLVDIPATIYWTVWQQSTFDVVCRIHVTLKAFFIPVSTLILVLIAIDRFFVICFVPSISLPKRVILTFLFSILGIGLALAIPMGLHTGVAHHSYRIASKDFIQGTSMRDNTSQIADFLRRMTRSNDTTKESFNFGPCEYDEQYISNPRYKYYIMVITAIFVVLFLIITLFYAFIFSFVWWRQVIWKRRYGTASYKHSLPADKDQDTEIYEWDHHKQNGKHKKRKSHKLSQKSSPVTTFFLKGPDEDNLNKSPRKCDDQEKIDGTQIELKPLKANEDDRKTSQETNPGQSFVTGQLPHRRTRPHIRTAQTLAVITVTFVVSYIPYLVIINDVLWPIQKWDIDNDQMPFSQHIRQILFYLYFLNSAANPIIYSCMNVTFRNEMIKLLQSIRSTFSRK